MEARYRHRGSSRKELTLKGRRNHTGGVTSSPLRALTLPLSASCTTSKEPSQGYCTTRGLRQTRIASKTAQPKRSFDTTQTGISRPKGSEESVAQEEGGMDNDDSVEGDEGGTIFGTDEIGAEEARTSILSALRGFSHPG